MGDAPDDTLGGATLCAARLLQVHMELARVTCRLLKDGLDLCAVRVVVLPRLPLEHKNVVGSYSFLHAGPPMAVEAWHHA